MTALAVHPPLWPKHVKVHTRPIQGKSNRSTGSGVQPCSPQRRTGEDDSPDHHSPLHGILHVCCARTGPAVSAVYEILSPFQAGHQGAHPAPRPPTTAHESAMIADCSAHEAAKYAISGAMGRIRLDCRRL
ncbi:MAG: hypothetical protein FRX48_05772 [Lasallia pustulata]|uniref:Uncharacterized protein n=1 Tax=Lasallia pustulata TaxID=136370 RepID=A0A5M8PLJ5_9LECA|nr:MAG: hypothetical protein FRX48_05772 [Lasallia pustulata]